MNIPAATKIDETTAKRAAGVINATRLKMADLLRIGLDRVLLEFDRTGSIDVMLPVASNRRLRKGTVAR